jgi:4-diphosphocytidyl-2-C-methyl-D-erythritol kinase
VACDDPAVPSGRDNICYKAALALQHFARAKKGADIRIYKRIPVGAGLGGGSSNAAAVLSGLNQLWGLRLPLAGLVKIAEALGSDVPFFLYDTVFAHGRGRGEKITPLNNIKKKVFWLIVVMPALHVSTPMIYRKWDLMQARKILADEGLTKGALNVKIITLGLADGSFRRKPGLFINDLEEVTSKLYPEVKRIRDKLAALGLCPVEMTGSGPAVFAVARSAKEARQVREDLALAHPSWKIFACRTL